MKLHLGQSRILRSKARFIVACCGTGGGKSFCGPYWLAQQVAANPGCNFIVAAPTYSILQSAVIPSIRRAWSGTQFEGRYLKAESKIQLSDGSTIWMRSLDNAAAIQGIVAAAVWIDEGFLLSSKDAWITAQQRVGHLMGKVLITSTPYGEGWASELVDLATHDVDYELIQWTSIQNPYYPREEYERAKRTLPPALFDMRYNGIFGLPENACCPDFSDANQTELSYDPTLPIYVGCDFNVSPMCWILTQRNADALLIYDEIFIPNQAKTQDALDELWNRHSNHHAHFYFMGDATSQSQHTAAAQTDYMQIQNDERFKKAIRFITFPPANPGHANSLNCLNAYVLNAAGERRLLIDPKCKHLTQDMQNARYKQGTRSIDKSSYDPHMLDSLRYITWMLQPLTPVNAPGPIARRTFR